MKRLSLLLMALSLWACDSDDGATEDEATPDAGASVEGQGQGLKVWIEPLAETLVSESLTLSVGCEGAIEALQLVVDDVVVAEAAAMADAPAEMTWDTSSVADGARRVVARAVAAGGETLDSDPLTVNVDNTAPVLTFEMKRLPILNGPSYIPFELVEANPAEIRVIYEDEIVATGEGTHNINFNPEGLEDGIRALSLEAVDALGRATRSAPIEFVVVNNGRKATIDYIPTNASAVPENYQDVEYHTQVIVPSEEGVRRVLTWLTWEDPTWEFEYDMGQGTCPHRGITYITESSDSGEILIDLSKEDLPSSIQMSFSAEQREAETFPVNNDPATFGSFFAHINPLSPADHINESIPIEVNMVLFY